MSDHYGPLRLRKDVACYVATGLLVAACALADAPRAPTVGLEGRASIVLPRADYAPRPVDDRAELILRIERVGPADGGGFRYDFQYLGLEPGEFPLSAHLLRADGEPAAELTGALLRVASVLPRDHDGHLAAAPRSRLPGLGGYRVALVVLGLLWVAGLVVLARKSRPKPAPTVAPPAPPPSLADLLRPLAEAAAAGALDAAGRARLERLIIGYWSERLALGDLPAAAVLPRLRAHPEGGALLRAVEEWLHSPRGAKPDDVKRVLEPYAMAAAPAGEKS